MKIMRDKGRSGKKYIVCSKFEMARDRVIRKNMLSIMLFIVKKLYKILYMFSIGPTLFKKAYASLLIWIGDMLGNFYL